MIKTSIKIPTGTLARRGLYYAILQVTKQFKSQMMIEYGDKTVNAKSLLGLLTLAPCHEQAEMFLITDGPDEEIAVDSTKKILDIINEKAEKGENF